LQELERLQQEGYCFALTFLDPPFNQGKEYAYFHDNLPDEEYWQWMRQVCEQVHTLTADGGSVFFMQREKNAEHVLRVLRESGFQLQNLIIWTKRTSAVPNEWRFGKSYQIIAFATKGAQAARVQPLAHRCAVAPRIPLRAGGWNVPYRCVGRHS
jgi:DNA modification methylase